MRRLILSALLSLFVLFFGCSGKSNVMDSESSACQNIPNSQDFVQPALITASTVDEVSDAHYYLQFSDQAKEISNSIFESTPMVRISNILDKGVVIVAEYKGWNGDWPSVYITTDVPVFDVFVSLVNNKNGFVDEQPYLYYPQRIAANEDWYIETEAFLYVPALTAGQAVSLPDRQFFNALCSGSYCRIAYTDNDGEYKVYLLTGGEYGCQPLVQVEPRYMNERYDAYYFEESKSGSIGYANLFPDDFSEMMLTGAFDPYIPKGFCIAGGSLGDINSDGIEDALICLTTRGYHRNTYRGVMPLLLLIGQQDSGYIIVQKISNALCVPYQDPSYPIAGKGYIDIVYEPYCAAFLNGWNYTSRFWYDEAYNNWLLKGLSEQYTFDDSGTIQLALVKALPDIMDLPINRFKRSVFYQSALDQEYFDAVSSFTVHAFLDYYDTFTFAVKLDEDTGCYEGYIHDYRGNSEYGGFIQTVRGDYKAGSGLSITSNEDDVSFTFQDDTWILNEQIGYAFHLARQAAQ